ncbi:MAG: ACP S-malonyltransferase [Bacteroidales bacterium]|nr:ACP S-malonyltransferase [Bacteroidales bacterium]
MLALASDTLDTDLTGFDFAENPMPDDELKSQYIAYIYSCAVADGLLAQNTAPVHVSGYSMGIYAALYYCGAIRFTDGLFLIRSAWEKISEATGDNRYGMGMIIGLKEDDITRFRGYGENVEICNRNNPYTYIISGKRDAVEAILSASLEEGALRASLLPVSMPYHSMILQTASARFGDAIRQTDIKNGKPVYFSALSQEEIITGDGLRRELICNIFSRMNWYETMKSLIEKGVTAFYECGAGDGLTKNFRFIGGSFKAYPVDKYRQFIDDPEATHSDDIFSQFDLP